MKKRSTDWRRLTIENNKRTLFEHETNHEVFETDLHRRENDYLCQNVLAKMFYERKTRASTPRGLCTPIALYKVQKKLRKCKKTAPGLDNVSYWFFRECWMLVAPAVTYLFNLCLSSGRPPVCIGKNRLFLQYLKQLNN